MKDYARYPNSEMHFGKFADSLAFQSWEVNFRTEVSTPSNHNALDQGSRDSKINRRSFDIAVDYRRRDLPDFEMLDAKIASALKQIISSVHL